MKRNTMKQYLAKLTALLITGIAAATIVGCDTGDAQAIRHTTPLEVTIDDTPALAPTLDDLFLTVLENAGVPIPSPGIVSHDHAITIATEVLCPELRAGTSWKLLGIALMQQGMDATHAGSLLGAANGAYCDDVVIDYESEAVFS